MILLYELHFAFCCGNDGISSENRLVLLVIVGLLDLKPVSPLFHLVGPLRFSPRPFGGSGPLSEDQPDFKHPVLQDSYYILIPALRLTVSCPATSHIDVAARCERRSTGPLTLTEAKQTPRTDFLLWGDVRCSWIREPAAEHKGKRFFIFRLFNQNREPRWAPSTPPSPPFE